MTEETTFDPGRRLCPDGTCIGVLDAQGRCNTCGKSSDGTSDAAPPVPSAAASVRTSEDGFDASRKLCPDGACLGVVVEGRCNVCGRADA